MWPEHGIDKDGNPFVVGHTYSYAGHELKLFRIVNEKWGEFILMKTYGSLEKGWKGMLQLDQYFEFLYPDADVTKNNKAASVLLDKE
jgi:hypothetical protein